MLATKRGNAVIHPKVKDSDSQVQRLYHTEFTCEDGSIDEDGAETFRTKLEPRIFKADGAQPVWESSPSEKFVEYERCGATWLITWKEIGGLSDIGDPFVLLITVPLSDRAILQL